MSNFESQNLKTDLYTPTQPAQNISSYEQVSLLQDRGKLQRQWQSGANWFYWIAGLSLLNFFISMIGGNWSSVAGLAIANIADPVARDLVGDAGSTVKIVEFAFHLLVDSVFAGFGFVAGNKRIWAFIVGIVVYMLDAILFSLGIAIVAVVIYKGFAVPLKSLLLLLSMCILAIAFHVYVLRQLFGGLHACQQLKLIAKS